MTRGAGEGDSVTSPATQSQQSSTHEAGTQPGAGRFSCLHCGTTVSLDALDELPECPRCRGESFERASIFERDTEPVTAEFDSRSEGGASPEWLAQVRESLSAPGCYLAYEDAGTRVVPLKRGWNRIGRSATAGIRIDDPTVSRRHALIVWETDGPLRVLDDRSLNGILVNDEPLDWATLTDGDELTIGRYRLYVLEA